MLNPESLSATPNATSSPESADGRSPCSSQDGQQTDPSGLAAVLASLSPRQAKAMGLLTSGTSGPPGTGSLSSADLQSWLASRLPVQLSDLGSTLYSLTWKPWVTPAGRTLVRQRASVRRTSATDRTGRVSPQASDGEKNMRSLEGSLSELARKGSAQDLCGAAVLTGWPTPTVGNAQGSQMAKDASPTGRRPDGSKATVSLPQVASFTGWPTPMAGTPAQNGNNAAGNNDSSRKTVEVCTSEQPARLTATGELLTGSDAAMASGGQLNPAHSRWLMAYPEGWDACAVTAMQSFPRKRRSSSKP